MTVHFDSNEFKRVYDTADCLYNREQVEAALDRVAAQMNEKFADQNPIFLCIMVGGIIPIGNLLPRLSFPLELDYVHATRYKGNTVGGELEWRAKHRLNLKDRTVIVMDDILDTGETLKAVMDVCKNEGAKEVYSVVLVGRKEPRTDVKADFVALTVGDRYVFGYGLDYKEHLRNVPGIYAVAEEFL